ncbi:hypothetical protein J6590_082255 [Homalodisca vitripennis]|nr:hypothetical protein J6590_082255 [Homalodisca vitripennis]
MCPLNNIFLSFQCSSDRSVHLLFLRSHLNHRQSCSNVKSPTEEDFYMNDETTDVSLLVQFTSTQEDEEEEENREREEDGGEEEEIISDNNDE